MGRLRPLHMKMKSRSRVPHTADHLVCLECGYRFKMLTRHLLTQHGMSPQGYRQRWNLSPSVPMVVQSLQQVLSDHRSRIPRSRYTRKNKATAERKLPSVEQTWKMVDGLSVARIAIWYDCSTSTIYRRLKEHPEEYEQWKADRGFLAHYQPDATTFKSEDVQGMANAKADHTQHHFVHRDGDHVHKTQQEMCMEYGLLRDSVSTLVNGLRKQLYGWAMYDRTQEQGFYWGRPSGSNNLNFDSTMRQWGNKDDDKRRYFGTTIGLFNFAPELRNVAGPRGIYEVASGRRLSAYGWYLINPPPRPVRPQTPEAIRNAKRHRNRAGRYT